MSQSCGGPSAEPFEGVTNEAVMSDYTRRLVDQARQHYKEGRSLLPEVQAFKEFIEQNPIVFTEFVSMLEGATEPPRNYVELVWMYDEIFHEAPMFSLKVTTPTYNIIARGVNTFSGFSAYTRENVNQQLKKIFDAWALYLASPRSCSVLTDVDEHGGDGWFSTAALDALMAEYNGRTFEQVFVCDPNKPYYGFNSFEDFFTRRYRSPEIDRPTGPIDNSSLIGAPCETTTYAYQTNMQLIDELFIKDQKYSLIHLLGNDSNTKEFVGGSILQGFLRITEYHRWHSPVNGIIKKIVSIPGAYFAQAPSTLNTPLPSFESDELFPYLQSLTWIANTATRQLFFIDADNAEIGLICFIAIGMCEVSSCQATVHEGQHVVRGEELGMFHFGGSSSALVFRAAANVVIEPKYTIPGTFIRINSIIAGVHPAEEEHCGNVVELK